MTNAAVIVGYKRSPFTFAHKGALADVRPDDMLAYVIKALVHESGIDPACIEDILLGCAFPEGEQGLNMARLAVFLADWPHTVAGATVNRWCGSSMETVHIAAGKIAMNAGDVFVCAGVESMSRIPMGGFNCMPHADLLERMPSVYASMGITAENVAAAKGIARAAQESYALASHQKAAAAHGWLAKEIVPIPTGAGTVVQDGCVRGDTTLEKMQTLKPAFLENGTVTPATASPLTDGAAAVLVCSESFATRHQLPMLARVHASAVVGCDPALMGLGPVPATHKVLQRAGVALNDIDVIELHEAFAVTALACMHDLGLDPQKVNIDGGAVAIGHPLGASGARVMGKAADILARQNGRYALVAQCIGGGQGIATILAR